MNLNIEWRLRDKVILYLDEKVAIGLVKEWRYSYSPSNGPLELNGMGVRTSQKVWDHVILPELTRLTKIYAKGNYAMLWQPLMSESGILVIWERRGD